MEHSEAAMSAALGKVFMVFGGFWVAVLIVLFFAVGGLLKKRERLLHKSHGGH